MDVDSRDGAVGAAGNRDVDPGTIGATELVKGRSGAVREGRSRAAGEHRGHEAPVAAEQPGRDEGVDAAVDAVQPAGLDPLSHRRRAEAEIDQLGQVEDAVLAGGEGMRGV